MPVNSYVFQQIVEEDKNSEKDLEGHLKAQNNTWIGSNPKTGTKEVQAVHPAKLFISLSAQGAGIVRRH